VTGRPLARSQDLVVEELGEELLVYDERTDRGHCLSAIAARVWRRCDGRTPAAGLSAQLDLDADTVERALDELEACELLQVQPEPSPNGGSTRRELAVKTAKVGAAAAVAPLIMSIVAPTAEAALSCELVGGCLDNCGSTGSGCQGTACVCCQIANCECGNQPPSKTCTCNGQRISWTGSPNTKFCNLGTAAQCPTQQAAVCFCSTHPDFHVCPSTASAESRSTQTQTQTAPGGGGGTQTTTTPTTTTPTTTTPGTTIPPSTPSTGSTTTPTP
jgi:hypothetical protein